MPLQRRDVESALVKKGFVHTEGANHGQFRLHVAGKRTEFATSLSRGTNYRELSDDLVSKIAGQVGLQKREFVSLVECTLSAAGYLKLLRDQKKLDGDDTAAEKVIPPGGK